MQEGTKQPGAPPDQPGEAQRPPQIEPTPSEVPDVLPGEPTRLPVPGDPVPEHGPLRDPQPDPAQRDKKAASINT